MSFKKGLEYRDGEIKLFDERVVLFPPNFISLLGSVYGQGSKPLLVYLGKKIGRFLVERWEESARPKDLNQLVNIFFEMTGMAGWGNFTIENVNDNEITVVLKDNIALSEERPTSYICDFLLGYLSGFGEFALYSASVVESQCSIIDKSKNSCVFKIQKR
jgi:predicted hydrocarbon binding protein